MARPMKKGLDYYPLDVNFLQDIKVRKIMRACGSQAITILISLLSSIYREEGYFIKWDNDISFLVADEIGASEGAVSEVVTKAVQVGFFNLKLFEKYQVLTSEGIQRRYIEAVGRRKEIELVSEYWLLDTVNENINLVNVDNNLINDDTSTQRKEKKRKEKESKEKKYVENDYLNDAILNFIQHRKQLKKPMTDRAIELFINRIVNEFGCIEEQIEAIDIAIERGWLSIKKDWIVNAKNSSKPKENQDFYGVADDWLKTTTGGL